jgi:shikimate kinase
MQRVPVIGCGGSGKTTIGRRVAAVIGAEAVHLDAVYYDAALTLASSRRRDP